MPDAAREPIQVYLTPEERARLDRVAREMGVSRSEALRRGIRAIAGRGEGEALRALVDEDLVTPPTAAPGEPPPSGPVAPLEDLLTELGEDRRDR